MSRKEPQRALLSAIRELDEQEGVTGCPDTLTELDLPGNNNSAENVYRSIDFLKKKTYIYVECMRAVTPLYNTASCVIRRGVVFFLFFLLQMMSLLLSIRYLPRSFRRSPS